MGTGKKRSAMYRRLVGRTRKRKYHRGGKNKARMLSRPFKQVKKLLFRAAVAAVFICLVLFVWQLVRPGERIRVNAETVAAFRVPYRSLGMLQAYAAKYEISFAELFTLFCAENNFFPDKAVAYDLSGLEQQYAKNFDALKRKYDPRSVAPYADMFALLFDEITCFPIPPAFDEDGVPSFMFGDSWGVTRNYEGDKYHQGADILDRENIRGRIPVLSMTGGNVQTAGWDGQLGYHVGIVTVNGTYYEYAHLDSLSEYAVVGQPIAAGQVIGRMGDSGARDNGGSFQVHLHIGISPKVSFTKNEFWINPYPFLRYIENTPVL